MIPIEFEADSTDVLTGRRRDINTPPRFRNYIEMDSQCKANNLSR